MSFISSENAISYVKDLEAKAKDKNDEPVFEAHTRRIKSKISAKNKEVVNLL